MESKAQLEPRLLHILMSYVWREAAHQIRDFLWRRYHRTSREGVPLRISNLLVTASHPGRQLAVVRLQHSISICDNWDGTSLRVTR
jgi:hypothetical protein